MASFVFTGDIGFDKYMTGRFAAPDLLSPEVLDFFHRADHVVANVEGAMIIAEDHGGKGIFFHAMDPNAAVFFDRIEADIWSLANNHSMDAGAEGLRSTMAHAKEHGAQTIGAGENNVLAAEPVIFPEDGGVGIFAVGYQPECIAADGEKPGNLSWNDFEKIENTVKKIKKTCKHCILVVHGGEEFCSVPITYIRERYHKYLSLGVDIVVGHHPHVPQNYELTEDGKAIFYSLGNFIFDTDYQRAQFFTDIGILLQLDLDEKGFRFTPLPVQIVRGEERIEAAKELPAIFTNIGEQEYKAMLPLACKAYMQNEIRRRLFMEHDKYKDYTEEMWQGYFEAGFSRYTKGEHLDYAYFLEGAAQPGDPDKLPAVRDYLVKQL